MSETIKVVGLVGSLRSGSLNRALVEAAAEVAPDGMEISIFPLNEIPPYNFDVEKNDGFPEAVVALRDAVQSADALILSTPEYNGSMSGVLKNAIDWASRGGLLGKKPVVTMAGSPGALGATKAQEHLRQVCMHLGMYVLPRPTVAVPHFGKKIENGVLTDEPTRGFIEQQMTVFKDWIERLS
ncbi:MAG: NADPH-dependent FMN reductase [Candidatus Promineifilaceae bacterium]